ncbi:MAG TPA: hypothetical protein VF755_16845 [Catenuloplanes sp.]
MTTTLTGGTLALTSFGFALGPRNLTGADQVFAAVDSSTGWSVNDARGTTGAWTVTVSGTDLTSVAGTGAGYNTIKTLGNENMKLNAPTVTPGAGADATPPTGTAINAIDTTAATLVASAVGGSKGLYNFTPAMVLTVPANTQASNYATGATGPQNAHTATLTVTLA